MAPERDPNSPPESSRGLTQTVHEQEQRKLRARRRHGTDIWAWLGTFGLVGWSVTMPTVLGVVVGRWLDGRWPGSVSWTLTCLLAGLAIGCGTGWYWVRQESRRD